MSYPIILTAATNSEGAPANGLRYIFKTPQTYKNRKVRMVYFGVYFSWFNITAKYNNNVFSYTWVNGQTYTVTMPDGFYAMENIVEFMQQVMRINKHYLIDNTNNQNRAVYFIDLTPNQTYYKISITVSLVPSILPVNYSLPPSPGWSLPNSTITPQINILNNNFQKITGWTYGSYPSTPQNDVFQDNGANTPVLSPVSSCFVRCNLIDDSLAPAFHDVIHIFAPTTTKFGGFFEDKNITPVYTKINDGSYNFIDIQLFGDDKEPLKIVDRSSFTVRLEIPE